MKKLSHTLTAGLIASCLYSCHPTASPKNTREYLQTKLSQLEKENKVNPNNMLILCYEIPQKRISPTQRNFSCPHCKQKTSILKELGECYASKLLLENDIREINAIAKEKELLFYFELDESLFCVNCHPVEKLRNFRLITIFTNKDGSEIYRNVTLLPEETNPTGEIELYTLKKFLHHEFDQKHNSKLEPESFDLDEIKFLKKIFTLQDLQ